MNTIPNQTAPKAVLELLVKNHPGVMSHICGLFARRAYNLDAIVCLPVGDGDESRMWLRLDETDRLPQIAAQVRKLQDVRELTMRHEDDFTLFDQVATAARPLAEA